MFTVLSAKASREAEVGAFCWCDLKTPDQDRSTAFYAGLWGWSYTHLDVGPGQRYAMATLEEQWIAGIEPSSLGASHWACYVRVEDVLLSTAKAQSLGAEVELGPLQALDHGRLVRFADPAGARLYMWEPLVHRGFRAQDPAVPFDVGELWVAEGEQAAVTGFYQSLFGWKFSADMPDAQGRSCFGIVNRGTLFARMRIGSTGPSRWLAGFSASDAQRAKALELGAKQVSEHLFEDPLGAEHLLLS